MLEIKEIKVTELTIGDMIIYSQKGDEEGCTCLAKILELDSENDENDDENYIIVYDELAISGVFTLSSRYELNLDDFVITENFGNITVEEFKEQFPEYLV